MSSHVFISPGDPAGIGPEITLKSLNNLNETRKFVIAGDIQYNDELKNYKNLANFIDLSGGVETSGLKDLSKIDFFLNKVNEIKNEA